MRKYVEASTLCRSVIIGNYLGDQHIKPCGICDNCLNQKKKEVNGKEFNEIHQSILDLVRVKPLTVPEIINNISHLPKEKTSEVIRFLQAEDKIGVSEDGKIFERS
jgi:ATP-dependent DNA helicase RecQ